MTILIIGRSGQVARALVVAGRATGRDVVALGRPDVNVADADSIGAAVGRVRPSVVINAAAYTAVDRAETEPDIAYAVNAVGAGLVAKACARASIPLLHLSTDYVFDGSKAGAYVEHDAVAPLNTYGRTKLEGELRVAAACPAHMIVRTSWIFSSHGTNFAKTILRLAGSRREVNVVDDQTGCPTYAPHLAAALLHLADVVRGMAGGPARDLPWGICHVAGDAEATWCGFARELLSCSARLGGAEADVRAIRSEQFPTPAARPRNSRLDCSKLERAFGLRLPDWREGVAACTRELLAIEPRQDVPFFSNAAAGRPR